MCHFMKSSKKKGHKNVFFFVVVGILPSPKHASSFSSCIFNGLRVHAWIKKLNFNIPSFLTFFFFFFFFMILGGGGGQETTALYIAS